MYKKLALQYKGDVPLLHEGTSMHNLNVALKVMDMGCCTESEYDTMSLGLQDLMDENLTLADLRQIIDWNVSVHHEIYFLLRYLIISEWW